MKKLKIWNIKKDSTPAFKKEGVLISLEHFLLKNHVLFDKLLPDSQDI